MRMGSKGWKGKIRSIHCFTSQMSFGKVQGMEKVTEITLHPFCDDIATAVELTSDTVRFTMVM